MIAKRVIFEPICTTISRLRVQLPPCNSLVTHATRIDSISAPMLLSQRFREFKLDCINAGCCFFAINFVTAKASPDDMPQLVEYKSVATALCSINTARGKRVQLQISMLRIYAIHTVQWLSLIQVETLHLYDSWGDRSCIKLHVRQAIKELFHCCVDHNVYRSRPVDAINCLDLIDGDKTTNSRVILTDDAELCNENCFHRSNNATSKMQRKRWDSSTNALMINYFEPLIDSGALYSAIELVELAVAAAIILPKWNGHIDKVHK